MPDTNILDVGCGVATSFESVAKHIVKHTKGSVKYIINPYNDSNYQFYTKADIKGIKDTYLWLYDKPFEPLNISDGVSRVFNQKYNKLKIH